MKKLWCLDSVLLLLIAAAGFLITDPIRSSVVIVGAYYLLGAKQYFRHQTREKDQDVSKDIAKLRQEINEMHTIMSLRR